MLLPHALAALHERWPALQVVVKTATNAALLDELRSGELDLVAGRRSDPSLMAALNFKFLHADPLVFIARSAHPLTRHAASLQAELGYPLIVYAEGTIPRHSTESFVSTRGLELPRNALQMLDPIAARALLACSDSVWITPLGAAREELKDGRIVRLPIQTPETEEPVGLLWRSSAQESRARKDMIDLLREAAARQAQGSS